MRYVVDTCVLVDHMRAYQPARDWLLSVKPQAGNLLYCPAVVRIELLAGQAKARETELRVVLGQMRFVGVDEAIADAAGAYLRSLGPSHGIGVPDALVAATAKVTRCPLVTCNRRHFPMTDIEILVPY